MTHWNYRLIEVEGGGVALAEVFYKTSKKGKVRIWAWGDADAPYGDTVAEAKRDYKNMRKAFDAPVLKLKDMPGYTPGATSAVAS
jgi:hypothetical protein